MPARLAFIALFIALMNSEDLAAADRPTGPIHKTRSAVMARHGMAATSQPLATATAIRVLQDGGNAIDAAIAANAVLGLVEPTSCGLGGDLFAIVWDAKTKKLYGLNASGRAPMAATIELYRSKGYTDIPTKGPLSWSVPGCVSGWEALRSKFGTKPYSDTLCLCDQVCRRGLPGQRDHRRGLAGIGPEPVASAIGRRDVVPERSGARRPATSSRIRGSPGRSG